MDVGVEVEVGIGILVGVAVSVTVEVGVGEVGVVFKHPTKISKMIKTENCFIIDKSLKQMSRILLTILKLS